MARLGRGRREGAKITRARSAPTATPLVRNRLTQTPRIAAGHASLMVRVWRRHRAHITLKARSTPTATPLVRNHLVQQRGVNRSRVVTRIRHHQARIIRPRVTIPALIVPSGINATSNVTGSVARIVAIKPAAINATSNVSGAVARLVAIKGSVNATSDLTGAVVVIRRIAPAAISATSLLSAVVNARKVIVGSVSATSVITATVTGGSGSVVFQMNQSDQWAIFFYHGG